MKKNRLKKRIAFIVIAALVANGLAGCGKKTVNAPPPFSAVKVQSVKISQMPSGEAFLGTVTPYVQTTVSPSISGVLSSVDVRVGDKVNSGQLLATVDTGLLQAQLGQANANQGLAQAQKESTQQKVGSALEQGKATLGTAETNLTNAKAAGSSTVALGEKTVEALRAQLDNQVAVAKKNLEAAEAQYSQARALKENAENQAEKAVASAEDNLAAIKKQYYAILAADRSNIDSLESALDQAKARLVLLESKEPKDTSAIAEAQASISQLTLSLEGAKGKLEIDEANSGITAAESALNNAEAALDAAENSEATKAASAQVRLAEQAVANAMAAKDAELTKALANLETAKTGAQNAINGAAAQYKQAQVGYQGLMNDQQYKVNDAQLAAARAGANIIKVQIDKGRITSPVGGYVVAVNAQAGQAVGPQGGFIMISSMDPLIATVEVPESKIAQFKNEMEMTVAIPATKETLQGKVAAVHPSPDPINKKYLIDIEIQGSGHELLSGMRADAYLSNEEDKAILIPADSVVTTKSGAYSVFVIKNGIATNQIVKVGKMTGSLYEITSGLTEGQKLVVQGQNLLSDGDKVRIINDVSTARMPENKRPNANNVESIKAKKDGMKP